jgi:hypothetical protein
LKAKKKESDIVGTIDKIAKIDVKIEKFQKEHIKKAVEAYISFNTSVFSSSIHSLTLLIRNVRKVRQPV